MIVIDSTVWIDFFNGASTAQVARLRSLLGQAPILVGDLMLCEVLQGLRTEAHAAAVEGYLRRFDVATIGGDEIAVAAARNFRLLRRRGVTVRKTIDLFIGTWCIRHGHALLHDDRDFRPMARHLGLKEVPIA